jgi:alkyl hydroperoxide reductase subunit AhpC
MAKGALVAVASDTPELRDQLVGKLGLKFPVVSDKDLTIAKSYGVQQEGCECSLPALYIIDAKDRIRLAQIGDNIVDRATSADIARALGEAAMPATAEASPAGASETATAKPTDTPSAPAKKKPKAKKGSTP